MAEITLIVGLNNPGPEYQATRHNAGAWFVEQLAKENNCALRMETKFHGLCGRVLLNNHETWLLLPATFMNHSGRAICAMMRFYQWQPEQVLVVHDELDLPPGVARLKQGGGHGGHNGLRDTITAAHSQQFYRLRLGIGHPGDRNQVIDYVLSKPSRSDSLAIYRAIDDALAVLPKVVSGDLAGAMQKLHTG